MYNVTLTTLTILQAIQIFQLSTEMFQTAKQTYIYILIYQGKLPTLKGNLPVRSPRPVRVAGKNSHFSKKEEIFVDEWVFPLELFGLSDLICSLFLGGLSVLGPQLWT